jgi:hypothetical protein
VTENRPALPRKETVSRRSYRRLMDLPAWGLYRLGAPEPYEGCHRRGGVCDCGERPCALPDLIVASVRAEDAHAARALFKQHGLQGDRVRRL